MQNTMMERPSRGQRPLGVTIIAVILLITGIFELVASIGLLLAAHVARVSTHIPHVLGLTLDVFGNVLGIVGLVIAVVTLIVAYGLFTLKAWAYWLVVVVEIITVIRHVLEFLAPNPSYASIIIGLILPIVILLYMFLDGNVRRAFRVL
jgi:uncharacterized membrane protein (DUF2068 family)